MAADPADDSATGGYGDYGGVVFYGPPVQGFWEDRLEVSSRLADPLFRALLDRGDQAPGVAREWNELTGWAASDTLQELTPEAATEWVDSLTSLSVADLTPHAAESAVTPEECARCAAVIADFLRERIDRGQKVYVESI